MRDIELFNDHFQNYKVYGVPKAQLVITDIPYNVGDDAYGSNPMWYNGRDNKNGKSELAGKAFFDTDHNFKIAEFMHFCSKMLRPEPKDNSGGKDIGATGKKSGGASCMIVFCAFEQQMQVIEYGAKYGFNKYIPLQFHKNYSPQVLKANMRVVGNTEYAILLYRNRLPKFNNGGRIVFNNIPYPRDTKTIKIHPTQKSVPLLQYLIELFTDKGDVVIDPCAGSGSTLLAAARCGRKAYGFEIKKDFYKDATEKVLRMIQPTLF